MGRYLASSVGGAVDLSGCGCQNKDLMLGSGVAGQPLWPLVGGRVIVLIRLGVCKMEHNKYSIVQKIAKRI